MFKLFKELPPPNYDYNVNKVVNAYKQAVHDIEQELAKLPIGDIRQAQSKAALANVAKVLKGLNKESAAWVEENIPLAAREGVARTLVSDGVAESIVEALEIVKFNRINKSMVEAAIADTQSDLLAVTQNIDRKTKSAIRKAVADSMRTNMAKRINGRKTISDDVLKGIQETLSSATSTGIIDAAGRRWKPEVYVDMVTRAKMMQTHNEATTNEAVSRGTYYAVISRHGAADPCKYHEGRIIKLLPEAPGDYPTYEELRASQQIFHPCCRHTYSPIRKLENLPQSVLEFAQKQARVGNKAIASRKRNPKDSDFL